MHKSAMQRMKWFIDNYVSRDKEIKVLDIGSYSVNGSYRDLFKGTKGQYIGLDIQSGPNVDIAVKDPYSWKEIDDEFFDFVISENAFEHIEYPWLTIKEIYRVLKQDGFACILAPFCLGEHRYPTDCYRYYPDGFRALAKWGGFKVVDATTGGLPQGAKISDWSLENYDDTMAILAKTDSEVFLKDLPKFNTEMRSSKIVKAG